MSENDEQGCQPSAELKFSCARCGELHPGTFVVDLELGRLVGTDCVHA